MAILEPETLKLKSNIVQVQRGVVEVGQDSNEAEYERILSAAVTAQNEIVSAIESKIGGTGSRAFGGTLIVTGNVSNVGEGTVTFDQSLDTDQYEVFLAPMEASLQYWNYQTRAESGFDVFAAVLANGVSVTMAWIVVY